MTSGDNPTTLFLHCDLFTVLRVRVVYPRTKAMQTNLLASRDFRFAKIDPTDKIAPIVT